MLCSIYKVCMGGMLAGKFYFSVPHFIFLYIFGYRANIFFPDRVIYPLVFCLILFRLFFRPSESAFRKGKRLPVAKSSSPPRNSQSPTSETTGSQRPTFRLEVTNPDHQQRAFEKQRPGNATFVVLDENNNTNQWIKNKNEKRWVPSWVKY